MDKKNYWVTEPEITPWLSEEDLVSKIEEIYHLVALDIPDVIWTYEKQRIGKRVYYDWQLFWPGKNATKAYAINLVSHKYLLQHLTIPVDIKENK